VALLALVASIGTAVGYTAGWFEPAKNLVESLWGWPQEGTEIVLDRSAAMARQFEPNLTKLEVARGVLSDDTTLSISDATNVAFRQFGGACNDSMTALALGFAKGSSGRLHSLLDAIQPEGEASLFLALQKAVRDFDGDRFKGKTKRIIVIWGGSVDCRGDSARSMKDIAQLLEDKSRADPNFRPDLRFIGMGLLPEQKDGLAKIAEVTNGQFIPVENRKELSVALSRALVIDPISDTVNNAVKVLNASVADLESFVEKVNSKDFVAARVDLEKANTDINNLSDFMKALSNSPNQPQFRKLHGLLIKSAEVQASLKEVARLALDAAVSNNIQKLNERGEEYKKHAVEYNATVNELQSTLQEIRRISSGV
jgi:outer membrane murein-binding lipoprotein Lpp